MTITKKIHTIHNKIYLYQNTPKQISFELHWHNKLYYAMNKIAKDDIMDTKLTFTKICQEIDNSVDYLL